nr:hypothetical protein [Citrobacter koseri]
MALASLNAGSDSNSHPAHGPLSNYRLHRIREILSKAAAQSDGGNIGYAMSDAVKAIDELLEVRKAEPVGYYRKGSDGFYFASPTEQRPGTIPLYRHAQPAPVDNTFIPKNLDRALGVVGVALPESKEEFNFQIERWIQRLIDRVIRYADEFRDQPAPVVLTDEQIDAVLDSQGNIAYVIADKRERLRMFAREILRAAMLQGDKS